MCLGREVIARGVSHTHIHAHVHPCVHSCTGAGAGARARKHTHTEKRERKKAGGIDAHISTPKKVDKTKRSSQSLNTIIK